jgi:hypothetical protein
MTFTTISDTTQAYLLSEIICPSLPSTVDSAEHTGSGKHVTDHHVYTCVNGTRNWDGHVTTELTCLGTGEWDRDTLIECKGMCVRLVFITFSFSVGTRA